MKYLDSCYHLRVQFIMADQSGGVLPAQASGQQTNPLSRKLNKILETRLENDKVLALFKSLVIFVNAVEMKDRALMFSNRPILLLP